MTKCEHCGRIAEKSNKSTICRTCGYIMHPVKQEKPVKLKDKQEEKYGY